MGCPEGQQGCPCGQGDTCDGDLQCVQGVCQPPPPPSCGDGVFNPGERCAAAPANSDPAACKTSGTPASCGDGFVGPNELCDQGPANSDTGACSTNCAPASCGDGIVGPGEQCDDGNKTDTDACTNACATAKCGDGIVHAGVEQCDLGGQNSNTGACTLACQNAKCGDGYVQPGETCDDGNQVDGDGCQKNCTPTPQMTLDACGFPADDGVWFEIDYSNAFTVTNPTWTYSATPGWGEAQWAAQGKSWPEVWDVFNNAKVITDQIGKVALLDGGNKAVQVMFGIGGLTYTSATVCVQGRSYSVGSSVTFTAQNQLNQCGGTGMLSNSWQVHTAGVNIGTCIVQNNEFQGLRVFPSGGSSALSLKKLRLTLHGAQY